jgi:transposase
LPQARRPVLAGSLSGDEVDRIIARTVSTQALAIERANRNDWRRRVKSAASFATDYSTPRRHHARGGTVSRTSRLGKIFSCQNLDRRTIRFMTNRTYKAGRCREQLSFLPPRVEDYVGPDNPVRAIEAYVCALNLEKLGFRHAGGGGGAGQPSYHPADLLKAYLYGYLNRVRSSRRLEQEAQRNLELMWLLKG